MQASTQVPHPVEPQTSSLQEAREWLDRCEFQERVARTLYRNARPREAAAFRTQWIQSEARVGRARARVDELADFERDGCDPDALYELRVVDER